jgi:hypothetical protein
MRAGIVTPSASAILRLITRVNRVGCSIGRSAGFRVSAPPAGEKWFPCARLGSYWEAVEEWLHYAALKYCPNSAYAKHALGDAWRPTDDQVMPIGERQHKREQWPRGRPRGGRQHAQFGAKPLHFAAFGDALIWGLEQQFGAAFTLER